MKVFLLRTGSVDCALDAGVVDQVLEAPPLFRLPQVPGAFFGVCLVDRVPVAVLRPGAPGPESTQVSYLVVLLTPLGRVGLPVSALPQVVEAQSTEGPEAAGSPADWQAGWIEHRGARWPLLDIGRLIPAPCS